MRRGFKTQAERLAESIWGDMGIGYAQKMDAIDLAEHVGATVRRADELTSRDKLEET